MLGVQHQRNVHCFFPALRRFFAVQQVQKMAADRVVIGFWLNTLAVVTVVIPVEQDGTERGQQLIGNITRRKRCAPLFPAAYSPAPIRRCASRPSDAMPLAALPVRYGR